MFLQMADSALLLIKLKRWLVTFSDHNPTDLNVKNSHVSTIGTGVR